MYVCLESVEYLSSVYSPGWMQVTIIMFVYKEFIDRHLGAVGMPLKTTS